MAIKRPDGHGRADNEHRGPSRHPKVDARLQYLLELPADELLSLKRSEDARSSDAARRLVAGDGSGALNCAPMTTGLRIRSQHGSDAVVASVFVIADASAADLRDLGATVRSQAGDIYTADVPLRQVERLAGSAAVRFVELARAHYPALHDAVPFSGIGALHAAMPAVDGSGVVVGIIDTAIDFYHPDFRDAGSKTRIEYLWDQRLTPVGGEAGPPAGLLAPMSTSYGVEYDRVDIDAALTGFVIGAGNAYTSVRHQVTASVNPLVGEHGTHVAGILAGNGLANAGADTGAAPAADIIFVAYPNLFDTAVLADNACLADGLAYIFARAGAMGRPCVANISVSDDQSAHDGSTAGERFIDELLKMPGRAVTLSAGNANNISAHAAGNVAAGGTTDLAIVYPVGAANSDAMEIWYDGQDRFAATITVPTVGPTSIGPIVAGDPAVKVVLASGVEVRVASIIDDPRNHANMISVIVVVPAGQTVPAGKWVLSLFGSTVVNGRFDAWVDRNNRTAAGRPVWQAPNVQEGRLTLGVPATCRNAITVGNHEKKLVNPALHVNSGRGPSRDGRVKPEIAAPGITVKAPRSRNMDIDPTGPTYLTMTGTSQSAPLVAGACALLFQCRGATATWADLKQILEDTASTSGIAAIPDAGFGFGYLKVASACSVPAPDVDVWLRDDAADTGSEPYTGPVGWLSPDIELLDTAGNPVGNPTHDTANRFNNIVRVTVRNRGLQTAHNTDVFLYWADPSTNITYPADWNDTGIFTGSPGFATKGNVIVVPTIASAGAVSVDFAWAPPAVGSNISGDDHFCLLVRVENANDPSQIGAGGWTMIGARNNIALHNLNVVEVVSGGDSLSGFEMVGSGEPDSLVIESTLAFAVTLELPAHLLPWRNLAMIEQRGVRGVYGHGTAGDDWLSDLAVGLEQDEIEPLTDIRGARSMLLRDGIAQIRLEPHAQVVVSTLRLAYGARASGRLRIGASHASATGGYVHIGQLAGGRRIGGVSIAVRRR
ncbi:MAG: S8 family serine peptidase [Burkholderiales bacterium]